MVLIVCSHFAFLHYLIILIAFPFYFIRQSSLFPSTHWTRTISMFCSGRNIIRCVNITPSMPFDFYWVEPFLTNRNTWTTAAWLYVLYYYATTQLLNDMQKWETDGQSKKMNSKEMTKTGNGKIQTNIEGLNPGATYTVRLRVMAEGSQSEAGKASPELIIDTEAVSCTPKPSCMILWCVWVCVCVRVVESFYVLVSLWE